MPKVYYAGESDEFVADGIVFPNARGLNPVPEGYAREVTDEQAAVMARWTANRAHDHNFYVWSAPEKAEEQVAPALGPQPGVATVADTEASGTTPPAMSDAARQAMESMPRGVEDDEPARARRGGKG